jgi:hypothetical protein
MLRGLAVEIVSASVLTGYITHVNWEKKYRAELLFESILKTSSKERDLRPWQRVSFLHYAIIFLPNSLTFAILLLSQSKFLNSFVCFYCLSRMNCSSISLNGWLRSSLIDDGKSLDDVSLFIIGFTLRQSFIINYPEQENDWVIEISEWILFDSVEQESREI